MPLGWLAYIKDGTKSVMPAAASEEEAISEMLYLVEYGPYRLGHAPHIQDFMLVIAMLLSKKLKAPEIG